MLYQMLDAIRFIHQSNVIHRDLKPANILVSCVDTRIKIADFGLSRYELDGWIVFCLFYRVYPFKSVFDACLLALQYCCIKRLCVAFFRVVGADLVVQHHGIPGAGESEGESSKAMREADQEESGEEEGTGELLWPPNPYSNASSNPNLLMPPPAPPITTTSNYPLPIPSGLAKVPLKRSLTKHVVWLLISLVLINVDVFILS